MRRSRIIIFLLFCALNLAVSAALSAALFYLWGDARAIPASLELLAGWDSDRIFNFSIEALVAICAGSFILYFISFLFREETRPTGALYMIGLALAAPLAMAVALFGGAGLGLPWEARWVLGGVALFALPMILFLFEGGAGALALALARLGEKLNVASAAGRMFGLARLFRPGNAALLRRQAMIEYEAGALDRAGPILEKLHSKGENDRRLLEILEQYYRGRREWGKQYDMLNELLEQRPNDAHCLRMLSACCEKRERWVEALSTREKCLDTHSLKDLEETAELAIRVEKWDRAVQHIIRLKEREQRPYRKSFRLFSAALKKAPDHLVALEEMADLLSRTEKEPQAAELWERALRHDPDRHETRRRLAEYYLRAGKLQAEEKHLTLLLEAGEANADLELRLAENLSDQDRAGEATEVVRLALTRYPEDFRFHYELSRRLVTSGDLEEGEKHLRRAEELGSEKDPSRLGALRRRLESQWGKRDLELIKRAARQAPDDIEARMKLVSRMATGNDWSNICMECDGLLEANPDALPAVIQGLRGLVGSTQRNYLLMDYLSDLLLKDRQFGELLELYESMSEKSMNPEETLLEGLRKILRAAPGFLPALARMAKLLHETQRWEEMLQICERLEQVSEENLGLGHAKRMFEGCMALRRGDEAGSYAMRILDEEPDNIDLRLLMVNFYDEEERFMEALNIVEECISIAPDDPRLMARQNRLMRKRKRQRMEELSRELKQHPDSAGSHFELAALSEEFEELDNAIAHYQRAAREPQLKAVATARLGHCLTQRGMFDLAAETFSHLSLEDEEINPEEMEEMTRLLYSSAILFENENQGPRALEIYKTIFRADASFRDIVSRIRRHGG